jgi:hypothetical protein
MINYADIQTGDKLRIVGMGAPGFAKLGDVVTVTKCTDAKGGRCDVRHDATGEEAFFALTCGASRLERVSLAPEAAESEAA